MSASEYADIFYKVLSAVTPILVAILGILQTKKNKSDKAYRKIRDEKEELERKQKEAIDERNNKKLTTLENSIAKLTNDVKELKKDVDIQQIEHQLNHLHTLIEFNFEYIHNLSGVVIMMGETLLSLDMLDADVRARLQQEVDEHKKKENELTSSLYKVIT